MKLTDARILLTGAAGGIGRATAGELARRGARLVLLDRDRGALATVVEELGAAGAQALPLVADLTRPGACADAVGGAIEALGGLDVLVNNAGVLSFRPFEHESEAGITALYAVNTVAPVLLALAAVRHFRAARRGLLLNVGSIFGSIGFPHFATYSSSKAAIRGFSEALRRELRDSGVEVSYVAPRATRTPLAQHFGAMAEATGMHLDPPELVAASIARVIESGRKETYLGRPEGFFVRLNGLLPRLVDLALAGPTRRARPFAELAAGAPPTVPAGSSCPPAGPAAAPALTFSSAAPADGPSRPLSSRTSCHE